MVWEAAAEGDEWVRCLGRKYAWEEVKVFRGGVVEFVRSKDRRCNGF